MNPSAPLPQASTTDRKKLIHLFAWLLGGDFAFVFFENVFTRFLPLFLKELNISNFMIGMLTGSTVAVVNIFFLPPISQWSDGLRSKWGRRLPFVFWSTPLTAFTVVMVGYAPETASWIHPLINSFLPQATLHHIILVQLCLWVLAFNFFNMILVNSFNWLVCDVVPQNILARFLSWFRVMGTLSVCVFMEYVFPFILTYRKEICLSVAVIYTIAFWLMCSKIKEGDYPPVQKAPHKPSIFKSFALYFKECLADPLHRKFFIAYTLVYSALASSNPFILLFSKETISLSMTDIGRAFSVGAIVSVGLYVIVGWICDKMNPILVTLTGVIFMGLISLAGYTWIHSKSGWLTYSIINTFPSIAWSIGFVITGVKIFPREKYGQFSSGLNVFGCGGLIVFNFFCGKLMDLTGSNYRIIFIWSFALMTIASYFLWKVYTEHKQRLTQTS